MNFFQKYKKQLTIFFSITFILGIVVYFLVSNNAKNNQEEETKTPTRKVEQINKLPIKDRPFVTLTPRADGREVTLSVDNLFGYEEAEYELEYQAEAMIQGVFGTLDFEGEKQPIEKELLFGSCSKGKCRYDENVSGGSLSLRLEGEETHVLKSDFNLQLMSDREGVFTSKDIKASLDVGSSLPSSTYLVVQTTMGLPAEIEGEVLAGPYAFLAATSPTLKSAELTIKTKQDLTNTKLLFFDGSEYTELEHEVGENEVTASVANLGTFVLVK